MIVNAPVAPPRSDADNSGRTLGATDRIDTGSKKPSADEGLRSRDGAFEQGLAEFEESRSFITKSRVVVGTIVIVLVVVGLVLFHPWSPSNVQPNPQTIETPSAETPATRTEPPATVPIPPVVQPVPESNAKPQPPVVKPPNKPPVDKTAKDDKAPRDKDKVKKPEDTPIQGFEGNNTYDGMTQKDISRLLQWAKSDAGNGNYAKAAQEYRVILQLQPNNSDAKEGLRKIQLAQGHN
jgi:hypothetical protein